MDAVTGNLAVKLSVCLSLLFRGPVTTPLRAVWWKNCQESCRECVRCGGRCQRILWIDWGRDSKPISPKYEPEALRLHLLTSLPFIIVAELWNGMVEKQNPIVTVHWWVGIAPSARWLGYRLCDRSIFVRFPTGINKFLFSEKFGLAVGSAHLHNQCLSGILFPGLKLRESTHSPSLTAEVKNDWSYTCTPHIPSCHARGV